MDEKDFAIRLARLREKKGVSARDMSLSLGQCESYINKIENSSQSLLAIHNFSDGFSALRICFLTQKENGQWKTQQHCINQIGFGLWCPHCSSLEFGI